MYTAPVMLPSQSRRVLKGRRAVVVAGFLATSLAAAAQADAQDLLIELHYKPVPNLQVAIWLEDADGKFVDDLFVTQLTGKLGIGNRPGRWDFLSSWRAPYGPRPSVLPVWAHRRGKTYPKLVFHDSNPADQESLGWHESTSSAETYFCRPLTPSEHEVISVDTMTCPSPAVFQSDKGRFADGEISYYPPRNDLIEFEEGADHDDTKMFSTLNDLDAVTGATPRGDEAEYLIATVPASAVSGPLTAYIEVSREDDQNSHWTFDRVKDHYVDPRLDSYGIGYLGQPSVVYKVTFDPRSEGFTGTSSYAGYGDWNGATGTLHPPDDTISSAGQSGADRLQQYTLNNETFRFGVYSYGGDGGGGSESDSDSDSDSDSGDSSDTGDTGMGGGGWGRCKQQTLAPVTDVSLEGMSFDKVRVHYTMPAQEPEFSLSRINVHLLTGDKPLKDNLGAALLPNFTVVHDGGPGQTSTLEIDQLWGNYTYQIGITYQDKCTNSSELAAASITTDAQKFQQVEGFCFLATAAYGAAWVSQVQALRWMRDAYLRGSNVGRDIVTFYYNYSPPLAGIIREQPLLRGMVRVVVQPVADLARLGTRG